MGKKKILFFITSLGGGGAEKVLINIFKRFDYNRFEVDLYTLFPIGVFLKDLPDSVKIHSLMPKTIIFRRIVYKLFFDLPLKLNIERITNFYVNLIIKNKYDFEIASMEGLPSKCIAMHTTKAYKIAWVHTDMQNNHYTKQWFKNDLEEIMMYHKFDKIIFVSKDVKVAFGKEFGEINAPQVIINNLIPISEIKLNANEYNPPKDIFTIVTVGRLEEQKCIDRLIRLAFNLKQAGEKFIINIVGTGYLENNLKWLAKDLAVESYINFIGFKLNPYPYVKNADIYINTSSSEGFPLSVCEAMVLGKALVRTKTAGVIELLDNNNYGVLVDEDDSSIYNGVKMIMDNKELQYYYENQSIARSIYFDEAKIMNGIYILLQ